MSTRRTGSRDILLFLKNHGHAASLSFRGEQMPDRTIEPLMKLLILLRASIQMVPNVLPISNHDDAHTFFGQRGDALRRLLMFNGLDLVFHLLALLLFRCCWRTATLNSHRAPFCCSIRHGRESSPTVSNWE